MHQREILGPHYFAAQVYFHFAHDIYNKSLYWPFQCKDQYKTHMYIIL